MPVVYPNRTPDSNNSATFSQGSSYNWTTAPSPLGRVLDTVATALDPSQARLKIAGLFSGGDTRVMTGSQPTVRITPEGPVPAEDDWRLRISLADYSIFGGDSNSLLAPVFNTNGVIFPYTPRVTVQHNAKYSQQQLTHSNYDAYFYEGSTAAPIIIDADFTVQNQQDGAYLLAVLWFFRSVTKMFVGNDTLAGNPPPMVFLNGYGDYYFPNVGCVVTQFSHQLPDGVDYVQVFPTGDVNSDVWLPTTSVINLALQPIYSRRNMHENFTLEKFSQGQLLGGGGRGGFI